MLRGSRRGQGAAIPSVLADQKLLYFDKTLVR